MLNIPYGRQTITEYDIKAVNDVLKSDYLTQGPEISKFEQAVANHHGAGYAVAFSSGTSALHAAYSALGVGDGDEIITSPITFVATANAAIYCGGRPVFADIDADTNCIDPKEIEIHISDKTKVISPVAYAGYPVDLEMIDTIAKKNDCRILYDAAHGIGSRRNGSFGMEHIDAAILSFHPVKHIAAGEGGMVLTNDEEVYNRLIAFRNHGITKDPTVMEKNDGPWYYEMHTLGYNFRITDMQCALASSQFKHIDENLKRRNEIARCYGEELKDLDFIGLPPDVGFQIVDMDDMDEVEDIHSYHLYTVSLPDGETRKRFYEYMHESGILVQIHYIPVHMQPYYRKTFGYHTGDLPVAEQFYAGEISIPMYHGLKEEQIEYIINKIRQFKA